jgi:hypothetical protein
VLVDGGDADIERFRDVAQLEAVHALDRDQPLDFVEDAFARAGRRATALHG